MNSVGKIIQIKRENSGSISSIEIGNLPKGFYFLNIITDNKAVTKKVIIQ